MSSERQPDPQPLRNQDWGDRHLALKQRRRRLRIFRPLTTHEERAELRKQIAQRELESGGLPDEDWGDFLNYDGPVEVVFDQPNLSRRMAKLEVKTVSIHTSNNII